VKQSPVWNQPLRQARAVAASSRLSPWFMAQGWSVRITNSPVAPGGTSISFSSIHLRKEGFNVVTNDVNDTAPIRQKLGLPAKFGSCHTAQVGGYVLEGHVPAQEVKRLLREKPAAIGLAVPGMPVGSPGMEVKGEMLGVRDVYDVLLATADGNSRVY
jgi:hypothetical protein